MERFWNKVSPEPNSGCWLWSGAVNKRGYGVFQLAGRPVTASRVALELFTGRPVPEGLFVLHSCDQRSCVNPAHLRVGTHADNMSDRSARGRCFRPERFPGGLMLGERNPAARLTADDVRAIRRLASEGRRNHAAIAARFGISRSAVQIIAARKVWRHVEG